MLKFIGTGSAFNTSLGNNGAFIKEDESLFMIDCGSSTFERLRKKEILEGVKQITVLVTHLHPDHIGSLGDLIFYAYYKMESAINVIVPSTSVAEQLQKILSIMAVDSELYSSKLYSMMVIPYESTITLCFGLEGSHKEISIEPVLTSHNPTLECYGYFIDYNGNSVYYSGDSNDIPEVVIKALENGDISKLYQDTCKADYEGNAHLSLRKLTELIKPELMDRVWCMHMDESFDKSEAIDLGFNVVQNVFEKSFRYIQPKKAMVYGVSLEQAKEKLFEIYEELSSQGTTFRRVEKDYFTTENGWRYVAVRTGSYARGHRASVAYVSDDISIREYHELILPTLAIASDPIVKFY